jgi:hypothetical protein
LNSISIVEVPFDDTGIHHGQNYTNRRVKWYKMDWFVLESNHMPLLFFKMKSSSCLLLNRNWNSWSASKLAVPGLSTYNAYRWIGKDNDTLSSLKQVVAAAHWSHKEACSQQVHVAEISHLISSMQIIKGGSGCSTTQEKNPKKN